MNSRAVNMSGMSLKGLIIGVAAGLAAGLLAAPMRGSDMRASLRSRADGARTRGMTLFEDGRRAFTRGRAAEDHAADVGGASRVAPEGERLTATLGEIADLHPGDSAAPFGARS